MANRRGPVLLLSLVLAVAVVVSGATPSESLQRPVRQYSGGTDVGYNSGRGERHRGGAPARVNRIKPCIDIHEIANGQVVCGFSGCRMRCMEGYSFIETERERTTTAFLTCDQRTGQMMFRGQIWRPQMTICSPVCEATCEHGGTCVAPNKCACAGPYTGDTCSEEPMLGDQPYGGYQSGALFLNQRRVECPPGSRMPDGSTSVTLSYRDNSWFFPDGRILLGVDQVTCDSAPPTSNKPPKTDVQRPVEEPKKPLPSTRPETEYVPKPDMGEYVQPECYPTCQNGGTCVRTNVCSCARGFWGRACEVNTCTYPLFTNSLNASLGGSLKRMKFECYRGHHTLQGKDRVIVHCRGGTWRHPDGRLLAEEDVRCIKDTSA